MMDAKDLWWRCGVIGAAVWVLGCSPPGSGDEDGGEGSSGSVTTGEIGFRGGGIAEAPTTEDIAAPLRLRVGVESRTEIPLLVFTPAQLPDETIDGVLLVVGGELTANAGLLRGVEEEKVEEIDEVVEIQPASRPGQLPRIPLDAPWTELGQAATRLERVTAAVEQLEITDYEAALWVVRGRVRVLEGPIVVTARDFFWMRDGSRILLAGEEEPPLALEGVKPRPLPPRPTKLGAAPGGSRPPGPSVGAGHGTPTGDPPAPPAGGTLASAPVPGGPTGSGPLLLWPVWPGQPAPTPWGPAPEDAPGEAPAGPTLPVPPPVLIGEEPVSAPEPQVVSCNTSGECGDGERCLVFTSNGVAVQECSDQCADGSSALCVDGAGCCNIDLVCSQAGTCVEPGTSDGEDDDGGGGVSTGGGTGNSGCNDDNNNGCTGGCNDPYPGCGNGLNEGCNSIGEGCNSAGQGCADAGNGCVQAGDATASGCGDAAGDGCSSAGDGCSSVGDGCSSAGDGCGDLFGGCGDFSFCRIDRDGRVGRPGRGAMSWFSWIVVFFVVCPRRRRRL